MPQPFAHNPLGSPFIELQSVDSTNNYARSLLHEGVAEHGTAIFAHEQFAGKGQRTRSWLTEKDANIVLTIMLKPAPLQVSEQFKLSMAIAVATQNFLSKYAGNDTRIKWPNDLYYGDRKAGGILIENIVSGSWQWAIIGIGINVNQVNFSPELPNPISLKQITNKDFDTILLAKELCDHLEKNFHQLIAGDFSPIYSQYNNYLYKKDKKVRLKKDNRVFEAIIKSVSPPGKLVVEHAIEEEFEFGEIEWIVETGK